jgi:RHS repeat-associated protein
MGSDPLDETDLAGNTNNASFNEYIFLGGKRLARRDSSNTVNYYFADHLGTARIVASAAGAPCSDSDFYPFGGERSISNTCSQNYKFTGKERDSESGLDNLGARYYASAIGRFVQTDPKAQSAHLSEPQTWNRYAYVSNQPLTFFDPNGLDKFLAVYVEQPGRGINTNPGHAFIGIKDTDKKTEVKVGFYPNAGPAGSIAVANGATVSGAIKNNDQHTYNVEKDFKLSDKQYQSLVDSVKQDAKNPPDYNLNNFNCADWVIQKADVAGVALPSQSGGEAHPNTPADLGQDLAGQGADTTPHAGPESGSSTSGDPQKTNDLTPLNQLPSSPQQAEKPKKDKDHP